MKGVSKQLDSFIRSLERAMQEENYAVRRPVRIYNDDLFIFCRVSDGRFRTTLDDYRIIGIRSASADKYYGKGISDCLSLTAAGKKQFLATVGGRESFVIIPSGRRVAIIYCGLLASMGIGVISLTKHPTSVISAIACGDYDHIFTDTRICSGRDAAVDTSSDTVGFINEYSEFRRDVLSVCGRSFAANDVSFASMIASAASLIGCEAVISENYREPNINTNRDIVAAMLLNIFADVRRISFDRCARIYSVALDLDDVLTVKYRYDPSAHASLEGEFGDGVEYCRCLSDLFLMPFSASMSGEEVEISFIPTKVDPSLSGLKASIIFDAERRKFILKPNS